MDLTSLTDILVAAAKLITTNVASETVKDGYANLKEQLLEKFGDSADVEDALTNVEKKPGSVSRKGMLEEELTAAGVVSDGAIASFYEQLLAALKEAGDVTIIAGGPAAVCGGAASDHGGVSVAGDALNSIFQTGAGFNIGSIDTLQLVSVVFADAQKAGNVSPKTLFWTYLNRVFHDTATLDLQGLDKRAITSAERSCLELAAIYTDLDIVLTENEFKEDVVTRKGQLRLCVDQNTRTSVLEFVEKYQWVALLGDPGSGKTTFANHLALCLAGQLLGHETINIKRFGGKWHRVLLPIRIVLREFAAWLAEGGKERSPKGNGLLWHYFKETLEVKEDLAGFVPLLNKHLLEEGGILVLDGLDEVPLANKLRQAVQQAVSEWKRQFPKARILLTSRTYAYRNQDWRLPDFDEAELAPFSAEQIETFVDRWYEHCAGPRPDPAIRDAAKGQAVFLKRAIRENDYLLELARRPLLLTLTAALHSWRGGSLPEQREKLYEESIDLLLDIWERPKIIPGSDGKPVIQNESAEEWFKASRTDIKERLEEMAFEIHASQRGTEGVADIGQERLVAALLKAADPDMKPQRVIEYIRDRAGLFINRGEGVYAFPHRSFQEYLAARYLSREGFPKRLVALVGEDPDRWREVLLLAGAKASRGTPMAGWALVERLCPAVCSPTEVKKAGAEPLAGIMLAGRLLAETGIHRSDTLDSIEKKVLDRVKGWLLGIMGSEHPPIERAEAGRILAKLGDKRKGVGLAEDRLPDIDWVKIEKGSFTMGSDKKKDPKAWDDEEPQGEYTIPYDYRISRYPVTNVQFRAFVDAKGYLVEKYWPAAITAGCWDEKGFGREDDKSKRLGPYEFGEPFSLANHPVVGVTWYEALAFCAWLTEQLHEADRLDKGRIITLPSEPEWEKAARGKDGRIYPWGDDPDPKRANYDKTGIGTTSAVGCFPKGASHPCGVEEMGGNVWEWTRSSWGSYPYPEEEEALGKREDTGAGKDTVRVLRGGSFDFDDRYVRCAFRIRYNPNYWGRNIGFRVVSPPF